MGRIIALDIVLFLIIVACVSAVVWVLVGLRARGESKKKKKNA